MAVNQRNHSCVLYDWLGVLQHTHWTPLGGRHLKTSDPESLDLLGRLPVRKYRTEHLVIALAWRSGVEVPEGVTMNPKKVTSPFLRCQFPIPSSVDTVHLQPNSQSSRLFLAKT